MEDQLGNRIKSQYESRARYSLPRRTYTIIRLDGKAFHTYTRNLKKPFDQDLISDMDQAVVSIMSEIQGAQFAYVQSDEVSILLTDFENINTDAWFDGNVQKMSSVSASLMTAEFNRMRLIRLNSPKESYTKDDLAGYSLKWLFDCNRKDISDFTFAHFDSRVFTIPDRTEVMNYFIWRNQDCCRNSISMVAQSVYSHWELHGKSSAQKQEMIFQKGINWSEYDIGLKNGRLVVKESYELSACQLAVMRHRWVTTPAWKFTQDKEKLMSMIPKQI